VCRQDFEKPGVGRLRFLEPAEGQVGPEGPFFRLHTERLELSLQCIPKKRHPLQIPLQAEPYHPRPAGVGKTPRTAEGDAKRPVTAAGLLGNFFYAIEVLRVHVPEKNHGQMNILHVDPPHIQAGSPDLSSDPFHNGFNIPWQLKSQEGTNPHEDTF
jgi:hypothetical protein